MRSSIKAKTVTFFGSCKWLPLFGGALLFSFAFLVTTAWADETTSDERIKRLALEALLENPQVLEEAFAKLQEMQAQQAEERIRLALIERRDELERDDNAPVLGNLDGSITVVEFFDYNCPYCKRAMGPIKELLAADTRVRLIYREWPILGQDSLVAARYALAAREQGAYEEMHWMLMGAERANRQSALAAASELGLDLEKLEKDMEAPEVVEHIQKSMELADAFGIRGTPAFIVGDNLAPGFVTLDRLQAMVEQAADAAAN